ncbi:hypothetical protein COO60DRAFT_604679 [Scenedesmus sp. NREL 46B-D3]|nr:hypothetical protein COO60DRAFT_604679 [Scenedesmus sp. NREL 46B-D3]
MHLLRASQHNLQHEISKHTSLKAGQRRLTVVRPRWGCQGRALHNRCRYVCSSSGSTRAAASVTTAVAAFNAHQLTCEVGSSSSVQDLLLVVQGSHRARQQRQQEQQQQQRQQEHQQRDLQHVVEEEQQLGQQMHQAPQHLALLEALQTQPIFAQPARSQALQQQPHAEPQQQQQQQQQHNVQDQHHHTSPPQHHAQCIQLQQHQQQLELHMLEQQQLHDWDMQQQLQPHHIALQAQQLQQQAEVLDVPLAGMPADLAQQRQRQKEQQQHPGHEAATSSSSSSSNSSSRTAVPLANGFGRQSSASASLDQPAAQQVVAGVVPRSSARPQQRQRRQQQQQHVLGLWNTRGWTRAEVLQGWRFSAADNIARTPLGHAMVRTNSGSQPHSLAAQLLRWLQREQCAELSAAGAGRTLTTLQAVAELQQQLEQQQLQLLVTPQSRSSRRPEGGRCTVYSLRCRCMPAGEAAAAVAGAPQQPAVQGQAQSASGGLPPAQAGQAHHHLPLQQGGHRSGQQQQQRQVEYGGSQHSQHRRQQQLPLAQVDGRQLHQPDLQQQHGQHGFWLQEHHYQQQQQQHSGHCMQVSGMVHLADAIQQQQQQQQQQRCRSTNGTSSHARRLHWQHAGLQLRLPTQQLDGCSSSHQQPAADLQQQHHLPDGWPSQAEVSSRQPVAAAAAPQGVLELDVRGSPAALSEQLELALQHHAAVCMPVVYDKQAAKLLEAAALLNRRWQQQQQHQPPYGSSSKAIGDASTAAPGVGCGGSVGLQLVLQLQEAWVQRQSGARPGLHVYVFAVPSVQ